MSRGRRRTPTEEELRLWEQIAGTVEPLAQRPATSAAKKAPPPETKEKPRAPAKAHAAPPLSAKPAPKPKQPPALNPLDRRTLGRVARGSVAIDARVDLHGLTQEEAKRRLSRFLRDAQAGGAKLALVITGKGRPARDASDVTPGRERGVLRRVVPMWLAAGEMRDVVIGFDEATPPHGGAGALYVRIRRAKR